MEILGIRIDNIDQKQALEKIKEFLEDGKQHYLVTPNPEFVIKARSDQEFKKILNGADLSVPDGIGLVFVSRFLSSRLKERVVGVDLMEKICHLAANENWSVFLLGAKQGVADKAADNLKQKYSNLKIGAGPFGKVVFNKGLISSKDSLLADQSFKKITVSKPAILFVALGAGNQEKWIVQNLERMPSVRLAIGVGGAFDFVSGRVRRAPKAFQRLGLEWFWRFCCQPWRIRRVLNSTIKFPYLVIRYGRKSD